MDGGATGFVVDERATRRHCAQRVQAVAKDCVFEDSRVFNILLHMTSTLTAPHANPASRSVRNMAASWAVRNMAASRFVVSCVGCLLRMFATPAHDSPFVRDEHVSSVLP